MSRQAYLEIYGQEPPEGARFGADLSWFQSSSDGESLDSGVLNDMWAGLAGWAEYVCIRCSYGSNGDDGAETAHVQYADRHGYAGTLGGYHYQIPGASPASNAANYLRRSAPLADRFVFDMLDVEEGTTAQAIEETLDRISQAKQRECLLYSGKSIMDNAGFLSRKRPLWVAHYASRSYAAWHPTSDWRLWQAPYMPNQYGTDYPTAWQFTSFTANHGHLDLNITTTPAAFGLDGALGPAEEDDMTPEQEAKIDAQAAKLDAVAAALADVDAVLRQTFNRGEWTGANLAGTDTMVRQTFSRGEQTSAAVAALPAAVTTAVTTAVAAAVAALPPGSSGGTLSPADLAKVQAAASTAVVEALESIHIAAANPDSK